MNPRFQKLASDWKTYVALVAAAGTVATTVTATVRGAAETFAVLRDLSPELRWVVAAVFLVVTIVFLVSALSRRSILLEPKRFLLSSENPEHLVGREEEVAHLARQCQRHAVVFLTGDSGSGKSSLVRAGLAHSLRAGDDITRAGRDLVPVVVDLSGVGWQRGLSLALARELGKLPEETWTALGGGSRPSAEQLFAWVRNRPAHSPWRLLLILDQFDDYLAVHHAHFYAGTTLRRSREIEDLNADWHGLAELLREGLLSLLVVARSDAAGSLPALCFVEEASIAREHLTRLEPNLVAPLLTRLTEPLDGHPVVGDPEFGWLQLRSRLLRDLEAAGDGQILPIQLAVALTSLRLSRYLTVAEYERIGGLRGLERLHVERHAEKAAAAARVSHAAVLEALRMMVSPDGAKTQPVARSDFEAVLSDRGATGDAAGRAVLQLEDDRVLRRVLGEGDQSETLLLYHDYLARGVREAHRQANLWTELLRERSQSYQEAIGWRQRWRALLSPAEQCRLLWERFRGRFSFNDRRGFVGLSTVRWLPIVLAVLVLVVGGKGLDNYRKEQIAAQVLGVIGHEFELTQEEAHQMRRLEAAGRAAAARALHLAAQDPAIAARASQRVDQLVSLAIGLDPEGDRSSTLATELVVPTLENPQTDAVSAVFAANVASRLHLTPGLAKQVASSIVARMKAEARSDALASMGSALGALCPKLDSQQVWPGAKALLARMESEQDSESITALGSALGALGANLDSQQTRPLAEALLARMKTDKDSYAFVTLSVALDALRAKLDNQQAWILAEVLLTRMKTDKDSYVVGTLGSILGALGAKLDSQQVRALAEELLARMKAEQDGNVLVTLGSALGVLCAKLDGQQARTGAEELLARMKTEENSDTLAGLGMALDALSTKLDSQQIRTGVEALLARMKTEQNSYSLTAMTPALGALSAKLGSQHARTGAEILLLRMNTERSSEALGSLGSALSTLNVKLDSQQVRPLVEALLARMKTEQNSYVSANLGSALAGLSASLETKNVIIPAIDEIVTATICEWQPRVLISLAQALSGLGSGLPQAFSLSAYSYPIRFEQVYVDLLKSPFVDDNSRAELLKGLERATGQTFSGNLWKFVDWATQTEAGRALGLDLEGPPPKIADGVQRQGV